MEEDLSKKLSNLSLSGSNPFESKDLSSLSSLLKSGHFKNIVLMVGAGISVNAGIPDFRSKGGLYDTLRQKGYPQPEILFDISFFKEKPELFYEVVGTLDTSQCKPTITHYFFKLLEEKNILRKCFTQNIDSLELKAGLSRNKLVQAHGNFESVFCVKCKAVGDVDVFFAHMKSKTVYKCGKCGGPIKPSVVFFGENLPASFSEGVHDIAKADLAIIIGTSLAVFPFAGLVDIIPKGTPRILINKYLENARGFRFDDPNVPDLSFQGDCDEILSMLIDLCGWKSDLEKMMMSYLGSIDFGTGSTRFILFDNKGEKVAMHQIELTQYFPEANMHEQDSMEYISTAWECIEKAVNIDVSLIKGIGISNQRETIIAWDKNTGQPLHRAIIWDDARTSDICKEFIEVQDKVKEKTGLPISTYFSATKIIWLIRNVPGVSEAITEKRCLFGTVECWAIYNLTKEKKHVTDISNASRTMLMNLKGYWDEELLSLFNIPLETLPKICGSAEIYGHLSSGVLAGVPLSGAAGDQQSALLGHHCLDVGSAKCTYGTGAFLLMNTGKTPQVSNSGLLTTVYGKFGENSEILYALEGAVECAGSAVKWMMNQMNLFSDYEELERLAGSVENSGGVICVPSFSGIFAPYWDNSATGVITGITQHTNKAHVARSVLEGVCFRTAELINALNADAKINVKVMSVDGGMTRNKLFVSEQANISGVTIEIPEEKDLTALGAAYAAGIGVGVYKNLEDLRKLVKKVEATVVPSGDSNRENRWKMWNEAIKRNIGSKL